MKKILIVGAGFSGSVVAEQLSNKYPNAQINVLEEKNHIGGNCYSERDESTGVMVHKYGPHIFHTDNERVWSYIQNFCTMMPFVNRVKTVYDGKVYSLPINLHTINQFFNKMMNPSEARSFIASLGDNTIIEAQNFEEQALKLIGEDLYKAFFYGYTKKQWGCEPSELPASILKRLPVRFDYNDNYYMSPYQGIPKDGYTAIFEKLLDQPNVQLHLNTPFDSNTDLSDYDLVVYTGPIDKFFNYKYGRLSYRTVSFERFEDIGDFQGNALMNYAEVSVPYTRIHEHKHFTPWESHDKTVYFKEYSFETQENDIPYYPKRLKDDMELLELYNQDIKTLRNISFLGRLATYRYMDMHNVIAEALSFSDKF